MDAALQTTPNHKPAARPRPLPLTTSHVSRCLHGIQSGTGPSLELAPSESIQGANKIRLSPRRQAARAQDAEDLKTAIAKAGTTVAQVARWLGLADDKTVHQWCEPTSGRSPAAGDIDALPATVRAAYRAIKQEREQGPELEARARLIQLAADALTTAMRAGDRGAMQRATALLDEATQACRGT